MDHLPLVRVLDRLANPHEDREARRDPEPLRFRMLEERPPADELHGEERLFRPADGVGPGVEDAGDPGVLEPARDLGFELEAAHEAFRRGARTHDLEGHDPPRTPLLGLVDDAHALFADLPEDLVPSEGGLLLFLLRSSTCWSGFRGPRSHRRPQLPEQRFAVARVPEPDCAGSAKHEVVLQLSAAFRPNDAREERVEFILAGTARRRTGSRGCRSGAQERVPTRLPP
jgi:hypothetical protein